MTSNEKPTFETVFDTLRAAADRALADAPELRSVAIVTDWSEGAADLPYGIMLGRDGPVRSPSGLHGVATQTLKMLFHQCRLFADLLAGGEDLADRLGKEIQSLEQRIRERKAALAATQGPAEGGDGPAGPELDAPAGGPAADQAQAAGGAAGPA